MSQRRALHIFLLLAVFISPLFVFAEEGGTAPGEDMPGGVTGDAEQPGVSMGETEGVGDTTMPEGESGTPNEEVIDAARPQDIDTETPTSANPEPNTPRTLPTVPIVDTESEEETNTAETAGDATTTPTEKEGGPMTYVWLTLAALGGITLGSAYGVTKALKGAKSAPSGDDPCGGIYTSLHAEKNALSAALLNIELQELAIQKIQKELEKKEQQIKKDIQNTAEDTILGKKDSNEVRRVYDAAQAVKGEYEKLKSEYEKAKTILEDLQKLMALGESKVASLEKAYAVCRGGTSTVPHALSLGSRFKLWQKSSLTLVPVTKEDIAKLIEIEKSVSGKKTYSAMVTEGEWREAIASGSVFIIKKDGKVIGDVSFEKKEEGHVHISGLALIPDAQGKGIGKEVMKLLLEKKELKDAGSIDLVTHPENISAVKLYTSLGFVQGETKENYFGDGEPRTIFTLKKK